MGATGKSNLDIIKRRNASKIAAGNGTYLPSQRNRSRSAESRNHVEKRRDQSREPPTEKKEG
jgi:hypothetical protein